MRVKLIAVVVAGLFAQNAVADDMFMWSGSLELGWRWTDIDGGTRNGAVGPPTVSTSPALPTPYAGPSDPAKAQEYQDLDSGAIGVFDIRGGNRLYYLRAFGEELGRDDQFINIVGGGYGVWKASLYSNNIPHNYSFNALTPLDGIGGTLLVGPGLPYPQSPNPNNWYSFNYGTQRNTFGGNVEFSNKSPWFVRADYNEVKTNGIKPSSTALGTGSGNGLIEFGVPADYKTKNTTIEGGYNSKQYGFKLAYVNSKFEDANEFAQFTNFYMRSGLDYVGLPPDNELDKWSINGYVKQLPWDSAIIARLSQSKLSNSLGIASANLKPTGNTPSGQFIPPGVGQLVTAPVTDFVTNTPLSTFEGDHKTTTANIAWNASPMAKLDLRVYYDYYDLENDSTQVYYLRGSQGSNCPAIPANSATCFTIAPYTPGHNFEYTKNSAGFDASWSFDRANKVLGGFDWVGTDRELEPAPKTDDYRYWIEYRNSGWNNLSGRVKYEYLQRRSDLDHSITNNNQAAAPTSVTYYFTAYDVSDMNRNMLRLNLDWTPLPKLLLGFGATWRDTDYKDTYYGRTNDRSEQYDLTAAWGDEKLRVTGLYNWGKVKFDQDYRVAASGQSPLPGDPQTATTFDWGTQNTQDGWVAAVGVDWAPTDRWMMNASYTYAKTGGGVDFWSGNYQGTGGFNGGPLVNYETDNTTLQRFLIKGTYVVNKNWSLNAGYSYEKYEYSDGQMAGYSSYYPYFQNLGSSNISWYTGAFANPSYKTNLVWLTVTYTFDRWMAGGK